MIDYPCAKINLGLNVVSKRPDGYHNLETVFYPVKLCDKLEIEEVEDNRSELPCMLSVDGIDIEGDVQDNLVVKAYNLIKTIHPELPHVTVKLTKNIPTQAGMGGGSSDCAYTITMLNRMFDIGMSTSYMQQLAAKLGADCAFFVEPVPSYATGIGDKLTPVSLNLDDYIICIVKPKLKISTKEAFANINPKYPSICCKDVVSRPVSMWKDVLVNDFELSLSPAHGEISDIKQRLYDLGAVYAAMSGSGSAMFGIFKDVPYDFVTNFPDCQCFVITGAQI